MKIHLFLILMLTSAITCNGMNENDYDDNGGIELTQLEDIQNLYPTIDNLGIEVHVPTTGQSTPQLRLEIYLQTCGLSSFDDIVSTSQNIIAVLKNAVQHDDEEVIELILSNDNIVNQLTIDNQILQCGYDLFNVINQWVNKKINELQPAKWYESNTSKENRLREHAEKICYLIAAYLNSYELWLDTFIKQSFWHLTTGNKYFIGYSTDFFRENDYLKKSFLIVCQKKNIHILSSILIAMSRTNGDDSHDWGHGLISKQCLRDVFLTMVQQENFWALDKFLSNNLTCKRLGFEVFEKVLKTTKNQTIIEMILTNDVVLKLLSKTTLEYFLPKITNQELQDKIQTTLAKK